MSGENSKWWRPGPKWLIGLPIGGVLMVAVGAFLTMGFNGAMHATNSNQFCYGCHIGMDTVVEEYKESVHVFNDLGIVATCADCHVPKEFFPKLGVKVAATKDIYHKLAGTITLENFEQKRGPLAQKVRDDMKARDSKECRNCHNADVWDLERQSEKAVQNHDQESWAEKDKTCVSCHIGVAHKKPR